MVPPYSYRVPRARQYSGYCQLNSPFRYRTFTLSCSLSHAILLGLLMLFAILTPEILLLLVWPVSRSLATTKEISVDFFSSPYLDVSVQAVFPFAPMNSVQNDGAAHHRIPPFGNLWVKACLRLTTEYRCLPRPSSAPNAKTFTLRSLQLNLVPSLKRI